MAADKADRLASLNLPRKAGGYPAALLDGTYREVVARLKDNAQIAFDDDGACTSRSRSRNPNRPPCWSCGPQ
nr:hypothetical protein [Streptomyces sp. 5-6(2022)]